MNIFDECTPGHISHTAISKLLAENPLYYETVGLQLVDLGPASLKLIDVWEQFGDGMGEPHECAFSLNNGGRSLFTVLAEEPVRAHRFDSAMKFSIQDQDPDFKEVLTAFDWQSLDKPGARLVDVGGNHGRVSQAIARHTKHLNFVVQDLPRVIEQGRASLPSEFQERIEFQAHDFKKPQVSESPSDAYLISRCIHNWSDHHATKILQALVPGLKPGSHVLIWDAIIDSEPVKNLSEKFNLQQDFLMATVFNGKDRTAEETEQLLKSADPRFKMVKVHKSKKCNLGMIDAIFDSSR
ncbi:unnamed protein product [Periconia digitata]|uniref:O-methyltransferase C-terminal domain-containing protein n=1 Tax=Periconia digitata TaxID=1303443 RepID=A0A9W4XNW3_9PLEO|nr:unnamed protein product [Periconia digitata]